MTPPQGNVLGKGRRLQIGRTSENILVRGGIEQRGPGKEQLEGLEGRGRDRRHQW